MAAKDLKLWHRSFIGFITGTLLGRGRGSTVPMGVDQMPHILSCLLILRIAQEATVPKARQFVLQYGLRNGPAKLHKPAEPNKLSENFNVKLTPRLKLKLTCGYR